MKCPCWKNQQTKHKKTHETESGQPSRQNNQFTENLGDRRTLTINKPQECVQQNPYCGELDRTSDLVSSNNDNERTKRKKKKWRWKRIDFKNLEGPITQLQYMNLICILIQINFLSS